MIYCVTNVRMIFRENHSLRLVVNVIKKNCILHLQNTNYRFHTEGYKSKQMNIAAKIKY